jgi:single-strand DNA-binding protein
MTTMTTVMVAGNLTRDPKIRYTGDGRAHSTLSLAVTRRWQNRDTQEPVAEPGHPGVGGGHYVLRSLLLAGAGRERGSQPYQGARIVVTGRLEQHSWENEGGDRRTKVEILADDIGASLRFATVEVQRAQRHNSAPEPVDEMALA